MNKIMSLQDAVAGIENGSTVALGGNVLHRAPMAAVREIARQGKRDLKIIKTAGAMDVDLLCFAGCVSSVDAGFISYESKYGLAGHYRKAVQSGSIKGNEHACYTVISALRAASVGVDFMPVKGLVNSELIDVNEYFSKVISPFSGEKYTVVKAIKPDYVIIHANVADKNGNVGISAPKYDDILMSRTGAKLIVTAEKIMPETYFAYSKEKADIPGFMVDCVVHCPKGAAPCSCQNEYNIDEKDIKRFKEFKDSTELDDYLESHVNNDRRN